MEGHTYDDLNSVLAYLIPIFLLAFILEMMYYNST